MSAPARTVTTFVDIGEDAIHLAEAVYQLYPDGLIREVIDQHGVPRFQLTGKDFPSS